MEKLLRSCPNIASIYMLVRPKKGKSSQERVNQIVEGEVRILSLAWQVRPVLMPKINQQTKDGENSFRLL